MIKTTTPGDMLLMAKDTPVLRINFDYGIFDVLHAPLLPYQLRQGLPHVPDYTEVKTRQDDIARQVAIQKCNRSVISFLSSRVLPLTRENAKKIYNLFQFSQMQDDISKAKVAIVCRALSLQDNYWLKLDTDTVTWDEVSLHKKHLNEAVAQVALHGGSLSLTKTREDPLSTPELTGQGAYAKAWVRHEDGLYLQKRGAKGSFESRIEVMVSKLLDHCNVDHLPYREAYAYDPIAKEDVYVCECKCMTTDHLSILSGLDFYSYCNRMGLDARAEALRIDAKAIYQMQIVDYLISNSDRHGLNWGFFYDSDTMEILRCHPLYDHNNSFDPALMQDEDARSLYDSRYTMKQAAMEAMQHVDFHFSRPFTREDFLTERQYQSFLHRAEELQIPYEQEQEQIEQFEH